MSNKNDRLLIMKAALQVYRDEGLSRDIRAIHEAMPRIYKKKGDMGPWIRFCLHNNVKNQDAFIHIAQVLSRYDDAGTKKKLSELFAKAYADKMMGAAIDRKGNMVTDFLTFARNTELAKFKIRDIYVYMKEFLVDDIVSFLEPYIRQHQTGKCIPAPTLLEKLRADNDLFTGQYSGDYRDNSKFLAAYKGGQDIIRIFREATSDVLSSDFLIRAVHPCITVTDIDRMTDRTCQSIRTVLEHENIPYEEDPIISPFGVPESEPPKPVAISKDYISGLTSSTIEDALFGTQMQIFAGDPDFEETLMSLDMDETEEEILREEFADTLGHELMFQIGILAEDFPDLFHLMVTVNITQAEIKRLVNAAFIRIDTMYPDNYPDIYEANMDIIAQQIISGYIALLLRKDRADTLKLLNPKANAGKKKAEEKAAKKNPFEEEYLQLQKENERLQRAAESATQESDNEKKRLKADNKELSGKVSDLASQLRDLQEQISRMKEESAELKSYIEDIESDEAPEEDAFSAEGTFLEAIEGKSILLWGVTTKVARKIADYPQITCITTDKTRNPNVTGKQLDKYDGVILATGHANHGMYWNVRDTVKNKGLPYVHMRKSEVNPSRIKEACISLSGRIDPAGESRKN